jgi:hypothetical protein
LRTRVRPDRPADVPVAGYALAPPDSAVRLAAGDVELPAPARLALTAGWNLAESLGLPLLAYAVGARLGGQGPGMRQPSAAHPGLDSFFRTVTWLWAGIFASSAIGLAVLLAAVPAPVFLLLTTVVTVAGVAAGTLISVLWFPRMLRRCGLRVRFGQA